MEYPRCLVFFSLFLLVISVYTALSYFMIRNFEKSTTKKQRLLLLLFAGAYDISLRQIGKLVYFNGDSEILKSSRGRKEVSRLILHPGTYLRDAFGTTTTTTTTFDYKKSFTDKQYDAFLKPGMLLE